MSDRYDGTERTIWSGGGYVHVRREGRVSHLTAEGETAHLRQLSARRYSITVGGKKVHGFRTDWHRAGAEFLAGVWWRDYLGLSAEEPPVPKRRGRR